MRKLYLHVGMGKTGSSFIQSCLANSHDALHELGIEYYHGSGGPAKEWEISSGNGPLLLNQPTSNFQFSQDNVLFSAESLYGHLATSGRLRRKLKLLCLKQSISSVRILMFIRDPVGHAESCYQQDVKRGGETQCPDAVFADYKMPLYAEALLTKDLGLPDTKITVLNYDRHRIDLLACVADFLEVDRGVLLPPDGPRIVNRSLTRAEFELQLRLNRQMGQSASFLSDALCNELPDIAPDRIYPPIPVQKVMLERLRSATDAVNAQIPKAEQYRDDLNEPVNQDALPLSRAQLDVIAAAFARRLTAS